MGFEETLTRAKDGDENAMFKLLKQYETLIKSASRRLRWVEFEDRISYAIYFFLRNVKRFKLEICQKIITTRRRLKLIQANGVAFSGEA